MFNLKPNKMRTTKQISEVVEKTIKEIRNSKDSKNKSISKICLKNNISEKHIRLVTGW